MKPKEPTLAERVRRLEAALSWAMGEDPKGYPEFTPRLLGQGAYWWRSTMRGIADGTIKRRPK